MTKIWQQSVPRSLKSKACQPSIDKNKNLPKLTWKIRQSTCKMNLKYCGDKIPGMGKNSASNFCRQTTIVCPHTTCRYRGKCCACSEHGIQLTRTIHWKKIKYNDHGIKRIPNCKWAQWQQRPISDFKWKKIIISGRTCCNSGNN